MKDALLELVQLISDITGGGVVTGVKGNSESAYRQGNVNITKANIGLGNVDNTADADKPISTAMQEALDSKQDELSFDTTPTASSSNPVTSGGVKTAIDAAKSEVEELIPDVSDFITNLVSDLVNYYTKTEVDSKISSIPKFSIEVVETLPVSGISETTVYLLKMSEAETGNLYTEYIYVNSAWEELGSQTLDLSGYVTTEALNTAIANFLNQTQVQTLIDTALEDYAKSEDLATIATSGALSDAAQDSTHRIVTDTEKATWNAKQDALTFDDVPTADSDNPVKSSGIKEAIDTVQAAVDAIEDGTTTVGKATEATKLSTSRNIALTGDVSGSASFNGSANASIEASLSNTGVTAGTYSVVTVDAKGRVTAGGQVIEVGTSGQDTPSESLAVGGIFFKRL